jgi:hypothetical protein
MEHVEAVVTAAESELGEALLDEALANAIRQLIKQSSPVGAQAGS